MVWFDGHLLECVLKPGKHVTPEQATPDELFKSGHGPGEPQHGDI